MKFFTNAAYNNEDNEKIASDPYALFVPKFTFSFGANCRLTERHIVGVSERFWSERGEVGNQNITNLNYTYKLGGYGLFLDLANSFDQNIQNPDVNSDRIPSIPSGAGRSVYAGVAYGL